VMPPTVSTPWLANLLLLPKSANAPEISTSAANRVGNRFSAKKPAIKMKTMAYGSGNHRAWMIELRI